MDVWPVMSLMWKRLRPRVSLPIEHSGEILRLLSAHHPPQQSVYRFGQLAGPTAFRWSSTAGPSLDVRRTGCLIARPHTDDSVCHCFTPACHCRVNLSSVIAPATGQTQAGVPPFCRISHVPRQQRKRTVLAQGQMSTPVFYC